MSALFIILTAGFIIMLILMGLLIWSLRSGQYDDLETPARRVLLEDLDEHRGS